MKKLIAAGTIALMTSGLSIADDHNKAGLFLEPAITYERGDATVNPQGGGSTDAEVDGFGLGARVGFHAWRSVFLGVDGRYSIPKFDGSGTGINEHAEAWNWGPVIGYQMPTDLGIRVWGSWIAGAELNPDEDNLVDYNFSDGKGYRVGAGLKLGNASLNLEYQRLTYDRARVSGPSGLTLGNGSELENKSWIASVSFPFSL